MTIDEAMRAGIGHHQAGRLLEARAIYQQILAQWPCSADALHLLGVIAQQRGELDASVDFIGRAIAANPGVPAAPLREIASGGELSRVMLALLGAAHGGGEATLVFDEIDAGIGGHTARAVGEQLRALASGRQILAITHLPQVASLAARHFTIAKDTSGAATSTTVSLLRDGAVVEELVRMLGATEDDDGARRHAQELLRAA